MDCVVAASLGEREVIGQSVKFEDQVDNFGGYESSLPSVFKIVQV